MRYALILAFIAILGIFLVSPNTDPFLLTRHKKPKEVAVQPELPTEQEAYDPKLLRKTTLSGPTLATEEAVLGFPTPIPIGSTAYYEILGRLKVGAIEALLIRDIGSNSLFAVKATSEDLAIGKSTRLHPGSLVSIRDGPTPEVRFIGQYTEEWLTLKKNIASGLIKPDNGTKRTKPE